MAYQQFTRASLRALVYSRLGQSANEFWRDNEVNRLIQEALRVFNSLTGFWRDRVSLGNTQAGVVWYALPSTLTSQMRMEWDSKVLAPASLWDLDYGRPGWEGETTTSGGGVPDEPQMWAPAGLKLIALWPADAAGGNSLVADGITRTPLLTSDADFVDIGQEELNGLLDYIQHVAVFKEGGAEFTAMQALFTNFLKCAATRNAMLMQSAKFRKWLGLDRDEALRPKRRESMRVGAR